MAVTLISTPDPFSLTMGGRTLYTFQGSGQQVTAGIAAQNIINFTGPVPDGTILTLRWNGTDHAIIARTTPSAADEFQAGDGSAAWVDSILPFFEEYFPFREDFYASRLDFLTQHKIVLSAKKPGTLYNISSPASISTIEVVIGTQGASPLVRDQYSVYAELWVARPDETEFRRVFTPTIATDAQGIARFDVGKLLLSQMLPDWPSWSFLQPTGGTYSHLRYYVCYGESYGTPQQIGRIQQDTIRHAYLGGASYLARGGSGFLLTGFVKPSVATGDDKALRWGSTTRYVRHDEPQFLTFLNTRADASDIVLEVTLMLSNQSTVIFTDRYAAQDWPLGAKLTYGIGIAQLQLAGKIPDGKSLIEYSVRLRNTAGTLYYSTSYRFIYQDNYQPYVRYFAYLNSLGAVDTLTTFGKGSYELQRTYEMAERYLPANYDVQLGQSVPYDLTTQQQIEVATGWKSKAELRLLDDVYRSPYLFLMKTTQALPIGITSKSIKQFKDGDTLLAHTFQFQFLYKEDFYTDLDEVASEPLPPPGQPVTTPIVITQPTVVESVDHTVPDVVRTIDQPTVTKWNTAFSWGNHAQQGYLTQASAAGLFFRKDSKIDWFQDLINKPTTRDTAGLSDVPTVAEVNASFHDRLFATLLIKPHLTSWTTTDEPQ